MGQRYPRRKVDLDKRIEVLNAATKPLISLVEVVFAGQRTRVELWKLKSDDEARKYESVGDEDVGEDITPKRGSGHAAFSDGARHFTFNSSAQDSTGQTTFPQVTISNESNNLQSTTAAFLAMAFHPSTKDVGLTFKLDAARYLIDRVADADGSQAEIQVATDDVSEVLIDAEMDYFPYQWTQYYGKPSSGTPSVQVSAYTERHSVGVVPKTFETVWYQPDGQIHRIEIGSLLSIKMDAPELVTDTWFTPKY
jgi:hypothetical protein